MNTQTLVPRLIAAALFLSGSLLSRAHDVEALVTELGPETKTANITGNYSAGATWIGGVAPHGDDVVLIPAGKTVTVNNTTPIAKTVIVRGVLRFSYTANSQLSVETIVVADGGQLIVGDYGSTGNSVPIPESRTATILIRDLATITQDTKRLARGIITSHQARVRMNSGLPRTPYVTFNDNLNQGMSGNIVTTTAVPADWRANDEIVIPATVFTREWLSTMPAAGTSRLQNELRTISAIGTAPAGITLSSPPAFDHLRADTTNGTVRVHAANLTRNIIIKSENTSGAVDRFGHVMFMGSNVKLTGVLFSNLGRTDKRGIASDPPANFNNPRGRYAVHFHKGGTEPGDPVALVSKCVVRGTPGWGFVNHAANVNFTQNVAFDFDGAGFVSEDGDELGTFDGNIAIGGTGNGEFAQKRTVFGINARMNQGDMGFTGDGFWFQGPDVVVTNNIAAGCKGSGFFYWCSGRFDPQVDPVTLAISGHYTKRPLSRTIPAGAIPRKWDHNGDGVAEGVLLSDMPLAGCSGNTAYACFTGMRIRFVNHSNNEIYDNTRPTLNLDGQVKKMDVNSPTYARFPISNCTFWNNLHGIHGSYLFNTDFSDISIVAAAARTVDPGTTPLPYVQDTGLGGVGIDFSHVNNGCTFTDVTVKNYTTGLWRDDLNTNPVTYNVNATGATFTGCTEAIFSTPVSNTDAKPAGATWFFMEENGNNAPDSPQ